MRSTLLCDSCKFDKKCDHECIEDLSTSWRSFVRCKAYIHDDGQPLTNAEYISSLLKVDLEEAARAIWIDAILSDGMIDTGDFIEWLKDEMY